MGSSRDWGKEKIGGMDDFPGREGGLPARDSGRLKQTIIFTHERERRRDRRRTREVGGEKGEIR